MSQQAKLFTDKIEFVHLPMVIGSGFEEDVARLAVEDGISYRAARKNMQIHSAIGLIVNDEFSGFFTFQNNHEVGEFYLLQSIIKPDVFDFGLYAQMVNKVLEQNTKGYPVIITRTPKLKLEKASLPYWILRIADL